MFCKKCGTENNEGVKFCKNCGNLLNEKTNICKNSKEENNEEKNICKKCGAENNKGTKFCKKCGNPLNKQNIPKTVSSIKNSANWYKSKSNKIIAGVCAGLAEKYNINPWILRIVLIITNFFVIGWFLDIAYIILIFTLKYDEFDSNANTDNTPYTSTSMPSISPQKIPKEKQSQTVVIKKQYQNKVESNSISPKNINEEKIAKTRKRPKTVKQSTLILAIIVVIDIMLLIILLILFFNGRYNNTNETTPLVTISETITEEITENVTEEETPPESETEEGTVYDEGLEDNTTRLYKDLPYYQLPTYNSKINGRITKTTIYTIVDEKYDESGYLWGKLKSGVGWVNLNDNDGLSELQE